MDQQQATIVLRRTSSEDVGVREIYVTIDGRDAGVLRPGDIVTKQVPPGRHVVKASNTLFRTTVEFDAAEGETIRYQCENGLSPGGIVMVLFMGVAYLKVKLVRL